MPSTSLNSSGLPTPASQKDRVIFFRVVFDQGSAERKAPKKDKSANGHTLSINPEELTVSEPSRVSVQQTIGSAWVDSFGPGLRTINVSGTTGWRAKNINGRDWEEEFKSLHDEAFKFWHTCREAEIAQGNDPDKVQLEFVDTLDRIAVYVVPQQFVLKRSKSRPLLVQYNIGMMVLKEVGYSFPELDPLMTPEPGLYDKALAGMDEASAKMEKLAAQIAAQISAAMAAVNRLLKTVNRAINAVKNLMHAIGSILTALKAIIKKITSAVKNLFAMLAAIRNFFGALRFMFQQVAAELNNLNCLLGYGLKDAWKLENYGDFNGASNCSSTTGGSPLSPLRDTNGFALLPIEARRPRLPKPVSAPESLARKAARQALADARATARRDARAATLAKKVWDSVAQFAIDHPSDTATANANAKHAIYLTKADIAATSQAVADQAAITFATTP